jgi:hypothetical protein
MDRIERVQSKYPYTSFGQNLNYDEGTQTYKIKEQLPDGRPVIYARFRLIGNLAPNAKVVAAATNDSKKALEMDSKKEEVMEREPVNIIINNFHSFIF